MKGRKRDACSESVQADSAERDEVHSPLKIYINSPGNIKNIFTHTHTHTTTSKGTYLFVDQIIPELIRLTIDV